jgi:CheY-like chemotaxis protein
MTEGPTSMLGGRRILVVEDDYLIAAELVQSLQELGVVVIGPARSVADALATVAGETPIDAAVLDVNLGVEKVFPVAARLQELGLTFVFATGYDQRIIPSAYASIPRFEKPVDICALAPILSDKLGLARSVPAPTD